MIKKANLESLMPTIYTKLKSLGEINDVVPISNIVSGLSKGEARAYVSNEDKNTDGVPDKIYIVYPKLNIDLQQDLNGVTTADIMAFPNVDSQKTHQVSNILAAITNVLNHEQDHLKGFKTHNNIDEFSPEHSAEHAGDEAARLFINKYTSLDRKENTGSNTMIEELKKLSTHLRSIKENELAEDLNRIIRKADNKDDNNADNRTGASVQADADESIAWLTSDPPSNDVTDPPSNDVADLLVTANIDTSRPSSINDTFYQNLELRQKEADSDTDDGGDTSTEDEAIDKYAQEKPGLAVVNRIKALFSKFKHLKPQTQLPDADALDMLALYYDKPMTTANREEELIKIITNAEKVFKDPRLKQRNLGARGKVDRQLSLIRDEVQHLRKPYQKYKKVQEELGKSNRMDFLKKDREEREILRTSSDKSLNLDNLFASSIMGSRNIK